MRRKRFIGQLWILAAMALLATVVGAIAAPAPASAQVACGATTYSVGNAADFNAAIGCYNAATAPAAYEILITGNFASTVLVNTVSFQIITQQAAGFELTIDGQGSTISGNPASGSHGLIVDGGADTLVTLQSLTIDQVSGAALVVQGNSVLFADDSAFTNTGQDGIVVRQSAEAALVSSLILDAGGAGVRALDQSSLDIVDSIVDASGVHGVLLGGDSFTRVVNTTISASGRNGIVAQRDGLVAFDSSVAVVSQSSILDNAGFGVVTVHDASMLVSNSTVSGSGQEGVMSFSTEDSQLANSTVVENAFDDVATDTTNSGEITVISSIVGECRNGAVDGGFNIGGCFGTPVINVGIPPFDNSCVVLQASRTGPACGLSIYPVTPSLSFSQGSCTESGIFFLAADFSVQGASAANPVPIDQRGFARPQGAACDIGAIEAATNVAVDDTGSLVAPAALTIDVVANDSQGEPVQSLTTTSALQGTVVVNADLSVTYTPGISSSTTDTFTYTACDQFQCDTATVTISITPPVCDGLNATIWGTAAGETIVGTAGNDVIASLGGDDVVSGGDGNDRICGGAGQDAATGGDGDDRLFGGADKDVLRGGPGVDHIIGNGGNDRLLGGIGGDFIDGGPGNDFLGGFGGADVLQGGPGNETIFGGFGADQIDGGDGNDTIFGLVGNDIINGGAGADTLNGDRGNDTINGGTGNDVIRGGNANDVLNGGSGDDDISGGKADDTMSGGGGTDTCTGNKQNVADSADATCETTFGVP